MLSLSTVSATTVSPSSVSPADLGAVIEAAPLPPEQKWLAVLGLVGIVLAVVFLIAGIFVSVRGVGVVNKKNPDSENKLMDATMKKSMGLIGCGVVAYAVYRFCFNYPQMRGEDYALAAVIVQSAWEAVYGYGFLILVPYIIKRWRQNARRNAYKGGDI